MSRDQITEHAGYLGDAVKLKAYRAALAELVEPGMSVLDLGSGTGILGILAAEAGARVVYAVDNGGILGPAGDIARSNGYGDRIIGMRGGKVVFDGTGAEADDEVFERIYGRSLTADDVIDKQAGSLG